jgi:predicted RNase H-like nuclease
MYYIGVDLAWSDNNLSGVSLIKDNKVVFCETMDSLEEIAAFICLYPNAQVGIDAPLHVTNQTGNREIEKEFLKDYRSKKLGIYPVNRNLLEDSDGLIRSEKLVEMIPQELGKNLFEVYPHATILECFHGSVLPYKRKKGRDTNFIKSQLNILQEYLKNSLEGDFAVDILELKGQRLKWHEDKLDSIVCAYTLLYCKQYTCKIYGDIFKVPQPLKLS